MLLGPHNLSEFGDTLFYLIIWYAMVIPDFTSKRKAASQKDNNSLLKVSRFHSKILISTMIFLLGLGPDFI